MRAGSRHTPAAIAKMQSRPDLAERARPAVVLGPAPCSSCHAPLFYIRTLGWREKSLYGAGRHHWRAHKCTARSPYPAPGQYVGLATPRLSGRAARGGRSAYRRLLGPANG